MEIRPLPDGLFALSHTGFSPALNRAARSIPGMRQQGRDWVGYPDAVEATASLLLAQKLRFDAGKGPEVLAQAKRIGDPIVPLAEKGLRGYQVEGVKFLINRGRTGAILAFGLGLGKTATGIRAARALSSKTVVVCPAAVKGVSDEAKSWRRELIQWWPKAKVYFPAGIKKAHGGLPCGNELRHGEAIPSDATVVVINYDILYAWLDVLLKWQPRICIFDEGHMALSGTESEPDKKSRRARACIDLIGACQHKWVLTGTPLLNYPKDLWGLLSAICPGRFGPADGFFRYGLRYCAAHQVEIEAIQKTVWDFKGSSHAPELKQRFSWFMLRKQMSDADVAMQLPPKVRVVSWLSPKKKSRPSASAITSRRELRAALDAAADAKLGPVAEIMIEEGYAPGGRIIFCWRKAVTQFFADSFRAAGLTNVEIITGEISLKEREKRIARARSTEGVLAVTIDSCGMGIDLTHASQTDFVEFVHEPWKFTQAEGRVHRFGQERPTAFRYFAMSGSADELIIDRVVNKLDVIDQVVGASDEEKSLRAKLSGEGFSEDDILKSIFEGVET